MGQWYEGQHCEVCDGALKRTRLFGKPPRLVTADGTTRDVSYVDTGRADELRASHALVCGNCYLNRYADVLNTARARSRSTAS